MVLERGSATTERRTIYSAPSGATITTGGGGGGGLSTSDKIAIGVGVPGGIGAVVCAVVAWYECWHKGRCRKSRKAGPSAQPVHVPAPQAASGFAITTPKIAEMDGTNRR